MNKTIQRQRNGFTLVEVAIVIVFMGIFITFASSMLKGIALSSKLRSARDKLATTSDAVQALAVNKREIPVNSNSFNSATGNPLDYWNKPYTFYSYSSQVHDVCRWSSTNLAVCLQGDCVNKVLKDVAYVLVSGADSLTVQTPVVTSGACSGLKCIQLFDASTTYDDLNKYVTLLELKRTVGCVEADSRLRIITNDLPFANVSSNIFNTNSFYVEAAGGVPIAPNKYRWSYKGDLPNGLAFSPPLTFTTYTTTQRLRIVGDTALPLPRVPTQAGTFSMTITATDNSTPPASASKPFVITIKPKSIPILP